MSFLTLYIDDIPVVELTFELPVRDKGLTRETNYSINRRVIENAVAEIKGANKERINGSGGRFYIMVSLGSQFPRENNDLVGREQKRKFDNLGNNFE